MRHAGLPASPGLQVGAQVEGLVVRTESGFHRVLADDQILVCRAPKRLLSGERTAQTAVVIGDRVRARVLDDGTGMVEELLERENELVRGAAGGSRYVDVIAANLDLLLVVHSLREPDFNAARVDRYVVMAESARVPVLLCLNKLDKSTPAEAGAIAELYRRIGYSVVITCAILGDGIDEVRAILRGKMSALLGPSGVGKSSLLNRIQPGLRLRTGEISESTNKGRHTTTTAELLALDAGGWVADTPGLRELGIRQVEPEELSHLFIEFRPMVEHCRFSNCTHREEPDCAIQAAVNAGEIDASRYRSYRHIYDEVKELGRF